MLTLLGELKFRKFSDILAFFRDNLLLVNVKNWATHKLGRSL